ncbi:MAG: hypothetical protein HS111_16455 [Kofleriaceae bacterium]|nr:hypothetical protein [Kofleriaceae bacterium]
MSDGPPDRPPGRSSAPPAAPPADPGDPPADPGDSTAATTALVPAAWLDDALALAERDPAGALRVVGEPGRLLAATANPEVAVAVLRAIAALAWRTADAAALLGRVERWPDAPSVARALARAQLDVAAANEYRHVYSPVLPPYLYELVAVAPYGPRRQRVAIGQALADELRADPGGYLALLDTLYARCHDLAAALTLVLVEEVAPARRELVALPPEIAAALDRGLDRLRGGAAFLLVTSAAVTAFVGGTMVGAAFLDPGIGLLAGGGAAALVGTMRGKVYGRWVRTPLAAVLAEVGVIRAVARERMRQRGGRLGRFAVTAGDDAPLRLFGMTAAAAATWAEGGGPVWQPTW